MVFLSTVYYESNLLQVLLILRARAILSTSDIAQRIASHKSKLYTYDVNKAFIENATRLVHLKSAIHTHPPNIEMDKVDLQKDIYHNAGILLDEVKLIHQRLQHIPPEVCANYELIF